MRVHTAHSRDAALRELRRVNRWLIAGCVVLTGVLTDVAAHAFPGKTLARTASKDRRASARAKRHGRKTSATNGALRTPEQAPQASSESPSQEAAQTDESTPAQESAPANESAPTQEPAPAQSAPEAPPESSEAVVSGGS